MENQEDLLWQRLRVSSESPNRTNNDLTINGNNHQTLDYLSIQPGSPQCLNRANINLNINDNNHQTSSDWLTIDNSVPKRKSLEKTGIQARLDKKRRLDRAYRERCKEQSIRTKEENDTLKAQIDRLKEEAAQQNQTLQSQEQKIKRLQREFVQLKGELHTQNTIVEVLSKQLAASQDIDLLHEIKLLRVHNDLLVRKLNNNVDKLILERNSQLEREKIVHQKTIEALCEKINNDKDH